MIKKYAFPSQSVAYSELNATPIPQTMYLQVEGAENAVDLGHWPITSGKFDEEGREIEPAVLSQDYLVDVYWFNPAEEVIEHLSQYEVFPNNPKHSFD